MLKNYFTVALRHLWKNRMYSLLTSIGLSVGIVYLLLAVLYAQNEWSYDQFHKKNPHLYRITTALVEHQGDQPKVTGGTGQVQGPAFKAQVPEIEEYVRVMGGDIFADVKGNDKILKLQTLYVDDSFFNVFTFKLLHGNLKTVLQEINAVVVTEQTARRFFNRTNVVGEFLYMDADPSVKRIGKPLIISGVVQDPPKNSSIQFDLLHPFRFMQVSFDDTNWLNAYLGTFVVLRPDADLQTVTRKFNRIYKLAAKEQLAQRLREQAINPRISYGLQRITDIHLNPLYQTTGNREGGIVQGSNPVYAYLFLGIASFILLMASINFINISIAGSLKRAKEVGIRKVTGSTQVQIIVQFLTESFLLCLLAFSLACIWLQIMLPVFNELSGKQINLGEVWNLKLAGYFACILLINCLLTGLYPSYIVSSFKPIEALYNKQKLGGRGSFGRSLVVFQFILSITMVIASFVFYRQMDYIRTKDLGYNPHQVIRTHINGNRDYKAIQQFLKNEVSRESSIAGISFGQEYGSQLTDTKVGNQALLSSYQAIDEEYIPLLGIKIKEGRNFSKDFPSDKLEGAIVNEAFVRATGLKNPIGVTITSDQVDKRSLTIIGVVKDFHFGSLRERIQPRVLFMTPGERGGIWLKVEKSRQPEAIHAFEKIYRKAMPDASYEYGFLDELNAREYEQEQRWQKIIGFTTGVSIVICCLGLFGLMHLAAQQRTKEIGIRKVLGASVSSIVLLLSKEFLQLVLLAFVIAVPIAWYTINQWLQDFAYRIEFSWWVFALAGILAFTIALLTVSFQAIKAALANPVRSLRNE
jgi:putative ABC transport system permease protein